MGHAWTTMTSSPYRACCGLARPYQAGSSSTLMAHISLSTSELGSCTVAFLNAHRGFEDTSQACLYLRGDCSGSASSAATISLCMRLCSQQRHQ